MRLKIFFGKSAFMALVCVMSVALMGADGAVTPKIPPGMVMVPDGAFWMGSSREEVEEVKKVFGKRELYARYPFDKQTPKRKVYLKAYYIDRTEVTNRQYAEFVNATGHLRAQGICSSRFKEPYRRFQLCEGCGKQLYLI